MQHQSDPGWSNPRVLTIFALIFFIGTVLGCALTLSYMHRHILHADPHVNSIESAGHYGLQGLKSELNLTPEQQHFIAQELDDYGKYYQNIEEERRDVAEHGMQRILDRLDEPQKKKFNDLFRHQMTAAKP
jgi:hypothetical protein